MHRNIFSLSFALAVAASPTARSTARYWGCSDHDIPVTISEQRYIIDTIVEDNFDAVAFTFNLTNRDFGKADDPVPIVDETDSPVTNNYTIGATLCGTGSKLLVLTHGIIESKLYVH